MAFEYTGIWRRSLAVQEKDDFVRARERLRQSYTQIWERSCQLSRQISAVLPGLTLHDEPHFQALWQAADLICGPEYFINPLEAFVFGVAVLIHDAGHAIETFSGGIDELKATEVWRDAVLAAFTRSNAEGEPTIDQLNNPSHDIVNEALFDVLRSHHAKRAETLAKLAFQSAKDRSKVYLIEDGELRDHLSRVIGQVAASHHWDLDKVAQLPKRIGNPGFMPGEWTISPLKLACLMRCADAIQIDQSRAPDFSYAMVRRSHLSEMHWRGQNRVAAPIVDPKDSSALLFTSTDSFAERDAEAWWVVHDAIKVANRELQGCSVLLRDMGESVFKINRIRDAVAPRRLSQHITTEGWHPVDARIRTGSTERVINLFGGEQLYGDRPAVALREMIQNAVDAVRARHADEKVDGYQGEVNVTITRDAIFEERDGVWLYIDDNGIGMSEQVLTGPLIEFSTSYWNSDLLRSEYPGLSAKVRKQTGRFGVGFFSCFMLSDRVLVSSRSYKSGISSFRTLSFSNGLKGRPILIDHSTASIPTGVSTRVSIFVSRKDMDKLLTVSSDPGDSYELMNIRQLVGHICISADCNIFVTTDNVREQVHHHKWYEADPVQWLRRICLADIRKSTQLDEFLLSMASNLRPIRSGEDVLGWAAIPYREVTSGVSALGGFISGHDVCWPQSFSPHWAGVLERTPSGPKRDGGTLACTPEQIGQWASEQAEIISSSTANAVQRYYASEMISHFGGDPTPIAFVSLNRELIEMGSVVDALMDGEVFFCPTSIDYPQDKRRAHISPLYFLRSPHYGIGLGKQDLNFCLKIIEGRSAAGHVKEYMWIPSDNDQAENSLIGCISRIISGRGGKLLLKFEENVKMATYIGLESPREGLRVGMDIISPALRLSVEC